MNAKDFPPPAPCPQSHWPYEERMEARLTRVETRLVVLMRSLGFDENGKKLSAPQVEETRK